MSPDERTKLIREYERLRKLSHELNVQADSFDQVLAASDVRPAKKGQKPSHCRGGFGCHHKGA